MRRLLGVIALLALFVGAAWLVRNGYDRAETAGDPTVFEPARSADESVPPPDEVEIAPAAIPPLPGPAAGTEAASAPEPGPAAGTEAADLSETPPPETEMASVEPSAAEAPESDEAASGTMPSFDIVRVEPSGDTVIAGLAAPDATVEVLDGAEPVATAEANERGEWALVLDVPLPPGTHDLAIRTTSPDRSVVTLSDQRVAVSVPEGGNEEPLVVLNAPDAPSLVMQVPAEPVIAAAPEAAGAPEATVEPSAAAETETAAAPPSQPAAAPTTPPPAPEAASVSADEPAAAMPAPETVVTVAPETPSTAATEVAAAPAAAEPETPSAAPVEDVAAEAPAPSARPAPETEIASVAPEPAETGETPTDMPPPVAAIEAVSSVPESEPPPSAAGESPPSIVEEASAPPAAIAEQPAAPAASGEEPAGPPLVEETPPPVEPKVGVAAVEAETDGALYVAGTATTPEPVRVYVDDEFVGEAVPGESGTWLVEASREMAPGEYTIRADQVEAATGAVIVRAEVPFEREIEVALLEQTGEAGGPGGAELSGSLAGPMSVIIKRGDNLWRISRELYGEGIRYSTIYQANRDQIRNPDRIYPGQVFILPAGDTAWETD